MADHSGIMVSRLIRRGWGGYEPMIFVEDVLTWRKRWFSGQLTRKYWLAMASNSDPAYLA